MLVNIWASIVHLSDRSFALPDSAAEPALDLMVCEGLHEATHRKQIWMMYPVWSTPGTTGQLLRDSYEALRASPESYLLMVTPGFADVANGVSPELVGRQLVELCRRGRAFNKRPIVTTLGVPAGAPGEVDARISALNEISRTTVEQFDGVVVDLRDVPCGPWTPSGARLALPEVARRLVQGVLESHCAASEWAALHA